MINKPIILTVALTGLAWPLAQATQAQTVSPLFGEWEASCEFFGAPARCKLEWKQGQHNSLIEMHYTVRADGEDGRALFNGRSTLKQTGEELHGYWTDSNGSMHPVFAKLSETGLESFWGEAATERGRSHYHFTESGSLEVTDWVLAESGWQQFMKVSYSSR